MVLSPVSLACRVACTALNIHTRYAHSSPMRCTLRSVWSSRAGTPSGPDSGPRNASRRSAGLYTRLAVKACANSSQQKREGCFPRCEGHLANRAFRRQDSWRGQAEAAVPGLSKPRSLAGARVRSQKEAAGAAHSPPRVRVSQNGRRSKEQGRPDGRDRRYRFFAGAAGAGQGRALARGWVSRLRLD